MNSLYIYGAIGGITLLVCLALVLTKHLHGHLSYDSVIGVQKAHAVPTPRIGGLGIMVGLCAGWALVTGDLNTLLAPLMWAAAPAFAIGFWEDLTQRVPVWLRLVVTMACGVLAWWLTGISLTRVDVPGADWLMAFLPFSVLFTAFALAGAANAFNIIDGFNGLAGGVLLVCLAAFAAISAQVGDMALMQLCVLLACAVAGFFVVNFPLGKIFLGDGGAYFLGFAVGWVAVLLPMRHAEVSVWATLLVCAYPILETLFSIVRRRRRRHSPGAADRLHLHSLVKRRVVSRLMPGASALARNSATGALMWVGAVLPAGLAVQWAGNSVALAISFGACALVYSTAYARLTQFRWCIAPATLALAPTMEG